MSVPLRIPFNRPTHTRLVDHYVAQALHSGHISGDGDFTRRCQELLERRCSATPTILLTTSCTHALEMMALLLDIGPGDEVIVPSFTFVSTVNAFVLRGATPVFVDIRPDTLNLDETQARGARSRRERKAIVPVHYAGVACEMDAIMRDRRHGTASRVVEDNAHGLFGALSRPAARDLRRAWPRRASTRPRTSLRRGRRARHQRSALRRPRRDHPREGHQPAATSSAAWSTNTRWVDIGSSYLPSDLLAALLLAQLEDREWVWEHRSTVWNRYAAELADWSRLNSVADAVRSRSTARRPTIFSHDHAVRAVTGCADRPSTGRGILAVFHYQPLHLSPFGQRVQPVSDCPGDRGYQRRAWFASRSTPTWSRSTPSGDRVSLRFAVEP